MLLSFTPYVDVRLKTVGALSADVALLDGSGSGRP